MSVRGTYLAKKGLIAQNLTSKGVEADSSMGLTTLANKILLVEGGEYSGSTDVSVRAVWEDNDDIKNIRPNTLKIALIGSDGSYRSIQLNADNSWQHTFTNIPQKYNNQNITYTVDTHETSHYRLSISGTQTEEYVITNTILTGNLTVGMRIDGVPEDMDISNLAVKIEGEDGRFPVVIRYSQMVNGVYEFTNVLEGIYSIMCYDFSLDDVYLLGDSVLGMSVNVQYNLSSTSTLYLHYSYGEEPIEETQSITTNIIWDDNNNQDGNRPDSVTVRLYANDVEVDSVTITESEGWSHTFTDLPIYDGGGEEANYTISCDPVEWYAPTFNGYTITETYQPETTSATVRKVWDDNNNTQSLRPTSITMTLSNGQSVVLNDTNGWGATIDNLPTRLNGESVTYTWTEEEVDGYTQSKTTDGTTTIFTNVISGKPPVSDDTKPPKTS